MKYRNSFCLLAILSLETALAAPECRIAATPYYDFENPNRSGCIINSSSVTRTNCFTRDDSTLSYEVVESDDFQLSLKIIVEKNSPKHSPNPIKDETDITIIPGSKEVLEVGDFSVNIECDGLEFSFPGEMDTHSQFDSEHPLNFSSSIYPGYPELPDLELYTPLEFSGPAPFIQTSSDQTSDSESESPPDNSDSMEDHDAEEGDDGDEQMEEVGNRENKVLDTQPIATKQRAIQDTEVNNTENKSKKRKNAPKIENDRLTPQERIMNQRFVLFFDDPYLTTEEVGKLAKQCNLKSKRVRQYFTKLRREIWKPIVQSAIAHSIEETHQKVLEASKRTPSIQEIEELQTKVNQGVALQQALLSRSRKPSGVKNGKIHYEYPLNETCSSFIKSYVVPRIDKQMVDDPDGQIAELEAAFGIRRSSSESGSGRNGPAQKKPRS